MKKNPKVSIVILNWNGWRDTIECLGSLFKINYPNYEVIVVDNGSTDESIEKIKKLKLKIKLIENKENVGFAEGNNVAIRKILKEKKSDFILLLNNDTVVDKNFLEGLVGVAQADERIGIVGPKVYFYKRKDEIQSAGSMVNLYFGKFPQVKSDKTREVDFVTGACFLIKTKVIKKIGLLDKRYFSNFEDADWCLRAKKAAFSVFYVPSSIIWHKVSRSFKKNKGQQIYYYTRNLFWFEFKYAALLSLLCFLVNYFLFVFPKYFFGYLLIKRNFAFLRSYTSGVIQGIFAQEG